MDENQIPELILLTRKIANYSTLLGSNFSRCETLNDLHSDTPWGKTDRSLVESNLSEIKDALKAIEDILKLNNLIME